MVPSIERSEDCSTIVVTMEGHLLGSECVPTIEKFHAFVAETAGSFRFVFKMHTMTSYEPEARRLWTEALRPYRSRVSVMRLEGVTNPIIRMAGRAVGLALGIPTQVEER